MIYHLSSINTLRKRINTHSDMLLNQVINMYMGGTPIFILKEGTERERGKDAQIGDINAAKAIADAVKSTLGPKGMDKMLVDSMGNVVITNDGVTILKEIDVEHPAAKMIVEIAETQDEECGDGTTSAVIIAGELLKRAEDLIGKIHTSTIAKGYLLASLKASEVLKKQMINIDVEDDETLMKIAATAMTGKTVATNKIQLQRMAVDAVRSIVEKTKKVYEADIDNIKIVKKAGGKIEDSTLIKGMILDKEKSHQDMPREIKKAKIALLDTAIEIKKTEAKASIGIKSPNQMKEFLDEEERYIKRSVDFVVNSGANVLFCQKSIDDLAKHYLAKNGIYAIESVNESDMEKLEKATGANIINNLKELSKDDLGKAGIIKERLISGERMTFIEDVAKGKAVTLLLRGGTEHVIDEIERAIEDALKVISITIEDGIVLPGGGAVDIELSHAVKDYAETLTGREQIAAQAFADALTVIPRTLAANAGMDGIDVLMKLTAAHGKKNGQNMGINLETETIEDMFKAGVIEPFRVKNQAIQSATEAANMILRIDDVIASKGFSRGGGKGGDFDDEDY